MVSLARLAAPMIIESKMIHVSITNTEGIMGILMISWSRGGHIGFIFLEIEKGTGPPSTSGYVDGHRVQMYVSITSTE